MKPYNSEAYAKFAQHKQLLHNLNPTLFHNSIFYGAFSFQNLEFLGDAVLETLIVTNAYIIFQKHNKQIVPDTLQKVKIALLANPFMARQSLANAFHHFIINHDADYTSYEETLHLTTPFKLYQTNLATLPKTLSDIWESIVSLSLSLFSSAAPSSSTEAGTPSSGPSARSTSPTSTTSAPTSTTSKTTSSPRSSSTAPSTSSPSSSPSTATTATSSTKSKYSPPAPEKTKGRPRRTAPSTSARSMIYDINTHTANNIFSIYFRSSNDSK